MTAKQAREAVLELRREEEVAQMRFIRSAIDQAILKKYMHTTFPNMHPYNENVLVNEGYTVLCAASDDGNSAIYTIRW